MTGGAQRWDLSPQGGHLTDSSSTAQPASPEATAPLQRVIATPILLGLCVLVFVLMVVTGVSAFEPEISQLISWGADYGPATLSGEWWRILTSMFIHIGALHLLLNGVCLWRLGVLAESLVGPGRFAGLYVLSGLGGSLLSLAVHPLTVSAGASAAIFGVAGALVALGYLRKLPLVLPSLRAGLGSVIPFVLYNLLGGLQGGIDNAAHIGGLATGLLIGVLVPLPDPSGSPARRSRTTLTFAGLLAALGAGAIGVARIQAPLVAYGRATQALDAGDATGGLPLLRASIARRPGFAPAYFALGFAYLRLDSLDQAVLALREANRLEPHNADYANQLGAAYFQLQNYDSALAAFSRTIEFGGSSSMGHYNKGLTLLSADRGREAIVEFRAAVALDPDSLAFRILLAQAYDAADSLRAGVAALDTVLLRRPNDVEAHYHRGLMYWKLHDLERARVDLRQASDLAAVTPEQQDYARQARRALDQLDGSDGGPRKH